MNSGCFENKKKYLEKFKFNKIIAFWRCSSLLYYLNLIWRENLVRNEINFKLCLKPFKMFV